MLLMRRGEMSLGKRVHATKKIYVRLRGRVKGIHVLYSPSLEDIWVTRVREG